MVPVQYKDVNTRSGLTACSRGLVTAASPQKEKSSGEQCSLQGPRHLLSFHAVSSSMALC
jgi:hypothetical protein